MREKIADGVQLAADSFRQNPGSETLLARLLPRTPPGGSMRNFRNLIVWQKSQDLALRIYRITKDFPSDERFRLVDQMCRAAISIPSNIAEGCGRSGDRELARFFTIAKGSTNELDSQLRLAKSLGYLGDDAYRDAMTSLQEVQKMLWAFFLKIRADSEQPSL